MSNLSNARLPGESFKDYRARRKMNAVAIKAYERRGLPATHNRNGAPYQIAPNGQWYCGTLFRKGTRVLPPLTVNGRAVSA